MGDLATGLLQGMASGKTQAQERELQASIRKTQAKLLELQLEEAQTKKSAMAGIEAKMAQPPTNPQTGLVAAPMQDAGTVPQKKPLLEMMAELSLPQLNAMGIDPTKITELQQQAAMQGQIKEAMGGAIPGGAGGGGQGGFGPPSFNMGPSGISMQLAPRSIGRIVQTGLSQVMLDEQGKPMGMLPAAAEIELVDQKMPDGSTVKVAINKADNSVVGIAGQGLGGAGGKIVTELPREQQFVPDNDLTNYIDKTTLLPPQSGTRYGDLNKTEQFVRVTPDQLKKIDAAKSALATYNQVNNMAVNLFSDISNKLGERSGKAAEMFINQYTQTNPDANVYNSMSSELVTLIRALGDVGAISDVQLREAQGLIPKLMPVPDSTEVARKKMEKLYKIITAPISTTIGADAVPKPENTMAPGQTLSNEELLRQIEAEAAKLRRELGG